MRKGITKTGLEKVALDRGCTVVESQLDIYYRSLNQTCTETFVTVMDGDIRVIQFNAALLDYWIPESYVVQKLNRYREV